MKEILVTHFLSEIAMSSSRFMKKYHHSKINIFEVFQTIFLAALVGFQLLAQNNLDNLPTQAQVDQLILGLNGISTQLTTLSLSLTGLITPLTAIITGITGALGGVTTFITLIVNFLRGLLGAILPRENQQSTDVMENILKTILDGFPGSTEQVLDKVIHGFPLQDVAPSLNLSTTESIHDMSAAENAVQINKILMLSSKKDQVNFYQYEFKRKKIKI